MTLLVVDDEIIIRKGLLDLPWDTVGVDKTEEAESGDAALRAMERKPADIVLCDIRMPGMDGLRLAEALHARYPDTLLVLLSGYSLFEYAQKAIKYGVFEYLLKPSSPEEILNCVQRAVCKRLSDSQGARRDQSGIISPFFDKFQHNEAVTEILRYLETHYMQEVSLGALAAHMSYSPQYLSRLIKRETSYNFVTLLSMIRMTRAAELLANTEEKVYLICEAVGMPDHRYFGQQFKSTFGDTPLQFRRAHYRENPPSLRRLVWDCVRRMDDRL